MAHLTIFWRISNSFQSKNRVFSRLIPSWKHCQKISSRKLQSFHPSCQYLTGTNFGNISLVVLIHGDIDVSIIIGFTPCGHIWYDVPQLYLVEPSWRAVKKQYTARLSDSVVQYQQKRRLFKKYCLVLWSFIYYTNLPIETKTPLLEFTVDGRQQDTRMPIRKGGYSHF